MPDEEIIEDSTKRRQSRVKSAYSVFLTNKRAIFRFDGLGSSLTQSFTYPEILDAEPSTRLFVRYIRVKTEKKDYFLNVPDADYWVEKILKVKEELPAFKKPEKSLTPQMKKRELLDMLTILRKNSLLTDGEFAEKIRLLDSMTV
jgi:hypothetical protein